MFKGLVTPRIFVREDCKSGLTFLLKKMPDLARLIDCPEAASKVDKISFISLHSEVEARNKKKLSSANKR